MCGKEAIKHVVGDVDGAIGVPSCKGRVRVIEYSFGEGEPLDLLSLFFPIFFSKFWSGGSFEVYLVGVLCYHI